MDQSITWSNSNWEPKPHRANVQRFSNGDFRALLDQHAHTEDGADCHSDQHANTRWHADGYRDNHALSHTHVDAYEYEDAHQYTNEHS